MSTVLLMSSTLTFRLIRKATCIALAALGGRERAALPFHFVRMVSDENYGKFKNYSEAKFAWLLIIRTCPPSSLIARRCLIRRAVRRHDRHQDDHPHVVPRRALLHKQALPMESQKINANSVKDEMQGNVSNKPGSNPKHCRFDRRQTGITLQGGGKPSHIISKFHRAFAWHRI